MFHSEFSSTVDKENVENNTNLSVLACNRPVQLAYTTEYRFIYKCTYIPSSLLPESDVSDRQKCLQHIVGLPNSYLLATKLSVYTIMARFD